MSNEFHKWVNAFFGTVCLACLIATAMISEAVREAKKDTFLLTNRAENKYVVDEIKNYSDTLYIYSSINGNGKDVVLLSKHKLNVNTGIYFIKK